MKRKSRKPKRPEGYRSTSMKLIMTSRERALLHIVKKKYNQKTDSRLSVVDLVILAIEEFSKRKKLTIQREQLNLFE